MKGWKVLRCLPDELIAGCLDTLFISEVDADCRGLVGLVEKLSPRGIWEIAMRHRRQNGVLPSGSDSECGNAVREMDVLEERRESVWRAIAEAIDGTGSRRLLSDTRQKFLFIFDESSHHGILIEK